VTAPGPASTAAAGLTGRRQCSGSITDPQAKGGSRPCGLLLPAELTAAGLLTHPCCDPGETWCLNCSRGPGGCYCPEPRHARPAAKPPASAVPDETPASGPAADAGAGRLPGETPAARAARLRRRGIMLCARPGARLTHADLDAAEEFGALLAERKEARRVPAR
jgi:hypothetical protein